MATIKFNVGTMQEIMLTCMAWDGRIHGGDGGEAVDTARHLSEGAHAAGTILSVWRRPLTLRKLPRSLESTQVHSRASRLSVKPRRGSSVSRHVASLGTVLMAVNLRSTVVGELS